MKAELTEAKKQLNIQIQVNSEVKKLLVASVGEDIEAKVDFLTQDKARLSADIRQYSNKISRDFEEKEKLYVESDLWKSKFLASSVIVDELARWKGMLMHRNEDCDHYIRLLKIISLYLHPQLPNYSNDSIRKKNEIHKNKRFFVASFLDSLKQVCF